MDDLNEEEIVSLTGEGSGRISPLEQDVLVRPSANKTRPFRTCWLALGVAIFAVFLVIFAGDSVELHISTASGGSTSGRGGGSNKEIPIHNPPTQEPGFKKHPAQLSDTYLPRAQAIDPAKKEKLIEQWGQWTFVDPKAAKRPKYDLFADYPNRDIPREDFSLHKHAWQTDKDYLSKFLPEAKALAERAMEAILAEYGHSKFDEPDKDFEERSLMFQQQYVTFERGTKFKKGYVEAERGGWTTERSEQGLMRRILHAIMTEDKFTFVMGGHSSSAGHGNNFQQSYTLQLQRALEPVFARLGVKFTSHNMGMGGLGTLQNALASGSLYGTDADMLMWDSSMTEREIEKQAIFVRQGLLAGERAPFMVHNTDQLLSSYYLDADIDVMEAHVWDRSYVGIPETTSIDQVETLPFAAQYFVCTGEMNPICKQPNIRYRNACWVDRPDVTLLEEQHEMAGGQASWHPGPRPHLVQAYAIAFPILKALHQGITMWMEADDFEIEDSVWHVNDYYENIRSKVAALANPEKTQCSGDLPHGLWMPDRICDFPLQGRSEYLPRRNPDATSLQSLLVYPDQLDPPGPNFYDPPDVPLWFQEVPDDAVDYLNIIESGVDFVPNRARIQTSPSPSSDDRQDRRHRVLSNPEIVPGKGFTLSTQTARDNCDGSYDSFCGRAPHSLCMLEAGNDFRGGIFFDGLSGWLIFNIRDVQKGLIILRVETWRGKELNPATEGWTCENNDCRRRLGEEPHPTPLKLDEPPRINNNHGLNQTVTSTERNLGRKKPPAPYCDEGKLQYAINGEIHTWNDGDELPSEMYWTILDDPTRLAGDVEVAIRATGCARQKTFLITHAYWA